MTETTIEKTKTPYGYSFLRSDGQRFFMIMIDNGSASLYAGASPDKPPVEGIVDFHVNISDKIEAARFHILGYKR